MLIAACVRVKGKIVLTKVREKETTEGDSDNSVGAHPQQRDSGGTTEVNAVPAAAVDAVAASSARQDFIFGKD